MKMVKCWLNWLTKYIKVNGVELIGTYKICRNVKYHLIIKYVTLINTITGWFEIPQYENSKLVIIKTIFKSVWPNR